MKILSSLFKKDCRMMVSGKFFLVALRSFLFYTLFIHFGYLNFMGNNANIYNVYLYKTDIVLYTGTEKVDRHRADYALSLLHSGSGYQPETVGDNTPEMKRRREITCELLFIEIVAVGFLGIASIC